MSGLLANLPPANQHVLPERVSSAKTVTPGECRQAPLMVTLASTRTAPFTVTDLPRQYVQYLEARRPWLPRASATMRPNSPATPCFYSGGEGGIRTHGTREGSTVFETARFNHSRTSPSFHFSGLRQQFANESA
jgi:hypothetical protein